MKSKMIFGFHAVTSRLRHEASSVEEIYVDAGREDRRMQELIRAAKAVNARVIQVDDQRLNNMVGTRRHQGVVAVAGELSLARNLDELLDLSMAAFDPGLGRHYRSAQSRRLFACRRRRWCSCRDRTQRPRSGLNATAAKVASGAAETVPYITVTNLARTLRELKERDILLVVRSTIPKKAYMRRIFLRAPPLSWVRRRGHAPPDPRNLRPAGQYSNAWLGGKPECIGCFGRMPL